MSQTLSKKDYAIGYAELTLAQSCVGLNVITGKYLIGYFPIFLLLALRFAIGFAGMLVLARILKISLVNTYEHFMGLSNKDKLLLIFQAACGGFLFNVFILYGMKTTTATSAGIISSITPIMIVILSVTLLREKINFQKTLAIVIVIIGLIVLNTGKTTDSVSGELIGNFLVLLAVVPEALFTILSRSIGKKMSEMEAVILVNFFNLMMFVPFALSDLGGSSWPTPPPFTIALLFLYGISGGIMFFLFWYRGLTKINASTAALFTGVMPVATTIFAFIFLREPIHGVEIMGMLLVILAIFIGCKKEIKS